MNKKLIVLAVTGAFAAPAIALAQASTVSIYGVTDASYEDVSASGATGTNQYASRGRIATNSSLIGFKGTENLGGGLTAIFQVENQISLDGVGGNNTQTMPNGWNTRDTFVGLAGNFGQARVGFLSTPHRQTLVKFDVMPGATGPGSSLNFIGRVNVGAVFNPLNVATNTTANTFGASGAGTGTLANNVGTVFRSQQIAYSTPDFNGFRALLGYTPNESRDNAPVGTGQAQRNPNLWNLALHYDNGPLSLGVSYLKLNDWTIQSVSTGNLTTLGLTGTEDTRNWVLGAAYTFGATKVSFMYDRVDGEFGLAGGGNVNLKRNAWYLGAKHSAGPHEIAGIYTRLGDNSVSGRALAANQTYGESGANAYVLRYGYNFSKRTQLYGVYAQVRNKANGTYDFSAIDPVLPGGTGGGAGTINAGADPRVIGVGLRHTF
ncbi:MAG: porin [Burkholderiales bacterium]|nr:porin [Burkholderiales bacterium]